MSEEMGATTESTSEVAVGETSQSTQTESLSNSPALGTTNTQSQDAETDGAEAAPLITYNPNLKFKYLDAKQNAKLEKEFDEWIKPVIKDSDTEKKVRELYEKAYGLDHAKSSREKVRTENETLRHENTETKRALGVLSTFVQNDDMQSFFEALKIPEDKVMKWALNRIQYRELPPEKRAEYDNMRNVQQRAALLEEQNQRLTEQYQTHSVQTRMSELDRSLADPQVGTVAQEFDRRMGYEGAFKKAVVERGQYYWAIHQQDIPVGQAVNEVLQMIGGMPQTAAPTSDIANQNASQGALGVSQTPERKPVIPNIQGRGTSPARKIPRSIADLKKISAELAS